ncbi:MAG TPA: GNAT family protein [Pyrinomonadaceae bacterium]|nr:GNAT family protein [Pyrinomonadaceae bacterium]
MNSSNDRETRDPVRGDEEERVRLVAPDARYAALWQRWRNEPATQRFNPLYPLSVEALAERLAHHCAADLRDRSRYEFRWMVARGAEVIGTVSVSNVSWGMGYAEIGYMLAESHHGRGLGTRAVALLVDKLFGETDLERLYALVATENTPSRRLLERLGFRSEGVMREHYVIQGARVDEVVYGLLRREWAAR